MEAFVVACFFFFNGIIPPLNIIPSQDGTMDPSQRIRVELSQRWFQLWFSPSVFVTTAWLNLMSDQFHVYQGEVSRTGALYFARGLPVSRSNSLVASCWSNICLLVGENWGLTKNCFIMVCWSFRKVLWIYIPGQNVEVPSLQFWCWVKASFSHCIVWCTSVFT